MGRRAALVAMALLSLTEIWGCWPLRRSPTAEDAEPKPTIVVVNNGHHANVNIYLLRDGIRTLLGKVNSLQRRTFQVPRSFQFGPFIDLRVVADAVGGPSLAFQEVRIWPGDEIKVYLGDRLQQSWITVRPQ
ncbi:MAG: hypothetical protein JSU87_09900 [Gemmatimonadota bacterium]|nr:MAG: hypothetical protein JSU87_09900 [Gemmatimonadota bacterium]